MTPIEGQGHKSKVKVTSRRSRSQQTKASDMFLFVVPLYVNLIYVTVLQFKTHQKGKGAYLCTMLINEKGFICVAYLCTRLICEKGFICVQDYL